MIKNRFKDDYSWNARLNGKGRVVDDICYTGYYYILPFSEKEKKKTNWINGVCSDPVGFTGGGRHGQSGFFQNFLGTLSISVYISSGILFSGRSFQLLE